MMKQKKTSRKQLLRFALILPVVAVLLFAFAQPEYKLQQTQQTASTVDSTSTQANNQNGILFSGIVHNEYGLPMPGASIVLEGTSIGTVADANGEFKLRMPDGWEAPGINDVKDNPKESRMSLKAKNGDFHPIVVSYVGYRRSESSSEIDRQNNYHLEVTMARKTISVSTYLDQSEVPPPAPAKIQPSGSDEVFVVVEDMPQYPGGQNALAKYIDEQKKKMKNKEFFEGNKLSGAAVIGFTITKTGAVTNLNLKRSSGDEKVNQYAAAIIRGMEEWTPGKQRGKAVPVDYVIKIEF